MTTDPDSGPQPTQTSRPTFGAARGPRAVDPGDDPIERMWAADRASQELGIEMMEATAGRAVARLRIEERHLNGLGVCHGGILLTLADTAMAFASNATGVTAFATGIEIDFLAPGRLGSTVTATATRTASAGRTGVYDTALRDGDGQLIAVTRGRTRDVPGGLT